MEGENKYEEYKLLAMLAEDSEYAFRQLFEQYKNHIYKVAALYIKSPSMAEEILQDVFIKVWLNRKTLTSIVSFESWLFTVSKNLILNYHKRLNTEWEAYEGYRLQHSKEDDDTDHKARTALYNELLQSAIAQLPQQQLLVYKLSREENLSYREIADRMSISILTVKTHMARALNAIRAFLRSHGESIPLLFFAASFHNFF